ncbi:riboflavin biosynthesis protein RibD [Nitritalea halalkaliphila LW7]|uniref:Riboflavin biosynthesis protein RibD n=1 Tax=Nitritalea halalkaliphila LW7 TaxID=1189621 RepID=I5C5E3_9BACT|nr:bifunctional diaminohydroxyphosphoribosylaminopyrimidine deaminase/5-amino-6-(5-phosphoribosylamino)uracil reductase RibD [Nitritalea halalkaliphila]EIM77045.1 riboflavin biosynthesis protein RibD [Nitritalea halalkaliphila LW7]
MSDERYMRRALELAALGAGHVSPNPMVGCVIVHEDEIIGEGYHQAYGGPHAEVHAVRAVQDPARLAASTVYVTLEPCAHWGKTPPCADLLVESAVKKVVIAALDTNPLVAGKGVAKLRAAGIEVEVGILEREVRHQNRRFFATLRRKRPYIILKWAQTADGFVARENGDSKWISSSLSRQLVHRWRAEEDAILVGAGTAIADNPRLDVRDWVGPSPTRVLLDEHLEVPEDRHVLADGQLTLIYHRQEEFTAPKVIQGPIYVPQGPGSQLHGSLEDLFGRGIRSIFVEGGAGILRSFVEQELWDEARVFTSAQRFHSGLAAPRLGVSAAHVEEIGGDQLAYYYREAQAEVADAPPGAFN